MAVDRNMDTFDALFDLNNPEDLHDREYILDAELKDLIKVLDSIVTCERKHDYTHQEWKKRKEAIKARLQKLGLGKSLRWNRQDHLPNNKSYVNVCLVPNQVHTNVACFLIYMSLKIGSPYTLEKTANIWGYVPKEKKRTGLRRP